MRIKANKHPAAAHITDVLVRGVPIMRGTCIWVDLVRDEACVFCTDANGKLRTDGDQIVERIIAGGISVRIPDEHRHMLSWGSGS